MQQLWHSLKQKNLTARGLSIKLKLADFQVLQHSKSFKQPFQNIHELTQALELLLAEMHIQPNWRFRLVGIGFYQLQKPAEHNQLNLW